MRNSAYILKYLFILRKIDNKCEIWIKLSTQENLYTF